MRVFIFFIFFINLVHSQKKNVTIILDAGHGGKDSGHLPHNEKFNQEKTLTLIISKKLEGYIKKNLINVNIIQTRSKDTYPSLDQRVKLANKKNADLFVSIHTNGSPKPLVRGTETHIHNKSSKKAFKLANLIENQFKNRAKRKSRGVKTHADRGCSLQVLKFTKMPSVLIECGFITNPSEGSYLNSTYGQEIIASAIFRAIRKYLKDTYPKIKFVENKNNKNNQEGVIYKVQIMSSIDTVKLNIPEFIKLKTVVERVKINSKSIYKYKYYIGKFKSHKEAKKMQKRAQENGFKDAFIVRFE